MDKLKEMISDNKRVIMIGGIGIIAVLVAIFVVKPFGGEFGQSPSENASGSTAVYVLGDIPEYTVITEEMVDLKEVGEEEAMGAFSRLEDVIGVETLDFIADGSIIQRGQLDELIDDPMGDYRPMGGELSSKVPDGLRAIMMPTGPAQGMVEFLDVGDKIDLLVSHTGDDGIETITPFQNIEVLLIDENNEPYYPEPEPTAEGEEVAESAPVMERSSGGSNVILAMTPEQTEVLSNMNVTGLLESAEITLRNKDDDEIKTLDKFGVANFDDWRSR